MLPRQQRILTIGAHAMAVHNHNHISCVFYGLGSPAFSQEDSQTEIRHICEQTLFGSLWIPRLTENEGDKCSLAHSSRGRKKVVAPVERAGNITKTKKPRKGNLLSNGSTKGDINSWFAKRVFQRSSWLRRISNNKPSSRDRTSFWPS